MPQLTTDHAGTARQLLAGVTRETPGDARRENLVAAETHAMLAIHAELAKINETLAEIRDREC